MAKARMSGKKKAGKKTTRKAGKKAGKKAPKKAPGKASTPGAVPSLPVAGGRLIPPPHGVTVRMYRQGFGDCYLLAFGDGDGGAPRYMLIDCGLVMSSASRSEKLGAVINDVVLATGGTPNGDKAATVKGSIDVLVTTHEHYDHVAGFIVPADPAAKGEGKKPGRLATSITVGAVWAAWTEDPKDGLANSLRAKFEKHVQALHAAKQGFGAAARAKVDRELGFYGAISSGGGAGGGLAASGASFSVETDRAMDIARSLGATVSYLKPGQLAPWPGGGGAGGVRMYVLGPPRNLSVLKKGDPVAGEGYSLGLAGSAEAMMGAAAGGGAGVDEVNRPFESWLQVDETRARGSEFFRRTYFGGEGATRWSAPAWRRLDVDAETDAAGLALQLSTSTNNTSLVLAIELPATGKVLLFAADAQAGNWRSWWDQPKGERDDQATGGGPLSWTLPAGVRSRLDHDGDGKVGIAEVLRATSLYKVGHHASHNGTLREMGLEKMKGADFAVMISVDGEDAKASGWPSIPEPHLIARLHELAGGRVLTSDRTSTAPDPKSPPAGASAAAWKAFCGRVKPGPREEVLGGPLYYDYTVEDA